MKEDVWNQAKLVLPCLCGGFLAADPKNSRMIEIEVRHHQRTYQHQNWFRRSRVVLGPCPCQGCRRWVTWNGWEWQDRGSGYHHVCPVDKLVHNSLARDATVSLGKQEPRPSSSRPGFPLAKSEPYRSRPTQVLAGLHTSRPPGRAARTASGEAPHIPGTGIAGSSPTQGASPDGSGHAEPITDQGAPGRGPDGHTRCTSRPTPESSRGQTATFLRTGGRVPPSPSQQPSVSRGRE